MKKKLNSIPRLSTGVELIDSHCHLDMDAYQRDLEATIKAATASGVKRIITIGIDLVSSLKAVELAMLHENIWATIGMHPHNAAADNLEKIYVQFEKLASTKANKIVGYGEIGLDFAKEYAPRNKQISCFKEQLIIAKKLNLPIIIHDRDAHGETMEILQHHAPFPAGGVMHCFSGDIALAREVIDLGLYVSIPGIITFNNSKAMQKVAREIPLNRMILETDGPFLAPVPFRGKINQPGYLLYTAQRIAELREKPLDEIARQTTSNAECLFRLNPGEQTA